MEYINEEECERALAEVLAEQRAKTGKKKTKLKDAMLPMAEKLNADIVICPALTEYSEYVYPSLRLTGGIIVHSTAAARVTGCKRSDGTVFDKERYRYYHDEMSSQGMAEVLALYCMQQALDDAKVRELIPAMTEWIKGNEEKKDDH